MREENTETTRKGGPSNELDALKEILRWTKVTSIPQVKKTLEETLKTDKEKLAYQLSTGSTSREIAATVGVDFSTILDWWEKWYGLGMAERVSAQRGDRGIRLFDLADFGIRFPKVPATAKCAALGTQKDGGKSP